MRESRNLGTCLVWAACMLALLGRAEAQEEEKPTDPHRLMTLRRVLLIVRDGDSFQACDYVHSLGTPLVVAQRYSDLLQDLYWQQHDVPHAVIFGRAGIRYCLEQAARSAKEDPATAAKLKSAAKTMAYHLAVNTWPGWNDEHVKLTASDMAAGFDSARLNLRLATELGRNDETLGNAHWLLGAHHLAAERHQAALDEFSTAATKFRLAKKPAHVAMANGYAGIVHLTQQPTREDGRLQLDKAVAALDALNSDEARSFLDQLETAAKVFVK